MIRSILLCLALSMLVPGTAWSQSLRFNEVCSANIDQFIDHSYNYGGWVEIYNPTDREISLAELTLRNTDNEGDVKEYTLSTLHESVLPHGYAVLWFDHHSSQGNYGSNASKQIPFKLDPDGGILELLSTQGTPIDALAYPPSIARSSYMRVETDNEETEASETPKTVSDEWGWTALPTPNAANKGPIVSERLQAPVVSTTGGTFHGSYHLQVTIPSGTRLYYTTDGSCPAPDISPSSPTGTFDGTQTCIYRFMLVGEGYLNSPVVTRSFIQDDKGFSLPVLSVSTAPKNLFDNKIGIYVRGTNGITANNSGTRANQNMDWERPVNMEYFLPSTEGINTEVLNQEVSMNIFGGWTRFNGKNEQWEARPSFKLKSGKVFEGLNSMPYPVFDSKPYIKIKNLLVRNGGQDQYTRFWDAAIQELVRTSGVYIDCQAWQPSHILLNGKYLGAFNLREESNKQFAFSNYGIDTDEIDQWEGDIVVMEGDRQKLNEWYDLTVQLAANPTDTLLWHEISQLVDIDEFCNYMAAEIYMGNDDWLRGGFKNLKGFRAKTEDGKFHIVMHDVDGGFDYTDMILQVMNKGRGSMPKRFCNMLKYEPFRKQFIDAYCLMDGSVFEPSRCRPIIQSMAEVMSKALLLEDTTAYARADLLYSRISDTEVRKPALKDNLKLAFDLADEYRVTLSSDNTEARLLLNGQEIPTGRFDGTLFPPVHLTALAPANSRFVGWNVEGQANVTDSVLVLDTFGVGTYQVTAQFQPVQTSSLPPICINEVSAANDIYINEYGKKGDWIELYNTTDDAINLAGMYVSDDADNPHKYQIQPSSDIGTMLKAHGHKVVWCDGKDPSTQLHASFKLKNKDASFVSITSADDAWSDSLRYEAQGRWQTFGRYPDGGDRWMHLYRPTIEQANSTTSSDTHVLMARDEEQTSIPAASPVDIASITYFNLQGMPIHDLRNEHIVIQRILFKDGRSVTRKVKLT